MVFVDYIPMRRINGTSTGDGGEREKAFSHAPSDLDVTDFAFVGIWGSYLHYSILIYIFSLALLLELCVAATKLF